MCNTATGCISHYLHLVLPNPKWLRPIENWAGSRPCVKNQEYVHILLTEDFTMNLHMQHIKVSTTGMKRVREWMMSGNQTLHANRTWFCSFNCCNSFSRPSLSLVIFIIVSSFCLIVASASDLRCFSVASWLLTVSWATKNIYTCDKK